MQDEAYDHGTRFLNARLHYGEVGSSNETMQEHARTVCEKVGLIVCMLDAVERAHGEAREGLGGDGGPLKAAT